MVTSRNSSAVLIALCVVATPFVVFAQTDEGSADNAADSLAREIEAQLKELDDEAEELSTSREAESGTQNEELWEEYQKYRKDRDDDDYHHSAERVEIGGGIIIDVDESIEGDVVAVGGPIEIYGKVGGDAVALGGDVTLHDGAYVDGDAVSIGGKVREEGTAVVRGERVSVDLGFPFDGMAWSFGSPFRSARPRYMSFGFDIAWLLAGAIFALLFYAVAGKRLDVVSRRIDAEPGQSFLIGLLAAFGTPLGFIVTVVLLAVTVIGILLIPILVIVLILMAAGGFYAVALAVGRRIAHSRSSDDELTPTRGPFFHLLVGLVALYALGILASLFELIGGFVQPIGMLLGVLGAFVLAFASILGYGALITSRFGTSPGGVTPPPTPVYAGGPGTASLPPPPPPPPVPRAPEAPEAPEAPSEEDASPKDETP